MNSSGRRLVASGALLLLLALLVFVFHPRDSEYRELLDQARAHAEKLERTAAAADYRRAAHLRPHAPLPRLSLSRLYLDWGRVDEALEALEEAERLGAAPVEGERLRVAIYVAQAETSVTAEPARWEAVLQHARSYLALDSEDREMRHTLARAYLHLQRWDSAAFVYRELLRSDPDDEEAHERLGALMLGEEPGAVEHLSLAETQLSQQLLATYAEASSVGRPAYANTRLGRLLLAHQEWALAARQLHMAVARNPNYADAHAYLGHALDQLGYADQAAPHLLGAREAMPESPVVHTLLGLHYDRLGDTEAARSQYERAYDLAPQDPAICVEIGQTWAAEGRYVAAEIWLQEAVSLRPDDSGLWEILARFYLDRNVAADERAVRAADRLLELLPQDARAHDLRGWAALQAGEYETAEEYLREAIELDPSLASAHYHLGLLEAVRGNTARAEQAFTRAADLDTTGKFRALVQRARDASEELW